MRPFSIANMRGCSSASASTGCSSSLWALPLPNVLSDSSGTGIDSIAMEKPSSLTSSQEVSSSARASLVSSLILPKRASFPMIVLTKDSIRAFASASALVDSIKEVLGINTKRTTADSNLLKVNKEVNKQILNQKMGLKGIGEINKTIIKNEESIEKTKKLEASLEKRLVEGAKDKIGRVNSELGQIKSKQKLIDLSLKEKFKPIFPPINLCSDNAAMIAMVGLEKYKLGSFDNLDFPPKPRWPLDEKATFLKGAGVIL